MTRQVIPYGVLCLFLCNQRMHRVFSKTTRIPRNCQGDVNIKPWEDEFAISDLSKIEIDLQESLQSYN